MREDLEIVSAGVPLAAWVYRPAAGPGSAPAVVLGHGVGGTRRMGLEPYAERFAEAGLVAVVIDYRGFGDSGGQPRQVLDIRGQRDDLRAALAATRRLPGVDADRVAVWGSSFGGGHAMVLAGDEPPPAAAVAQCPFTDGPSSTLALGPVGALRIAPFALADLTRAVRRAEPVTVPAAGRPGTTGLMVAPDAYPGYQALAPQPGDEPPRIAARFGLQIGLDRPGRALRKARCPVFVAVCDDDTVAPARATLRHVERARAAGVAVEVRRYPVGHFDIYLGEAFETTVADQVDFLRRNLGLAG